MSPTKKIPACCRPVLGAPLDKADAEALARAFKVIADPARLRLLSLIGSHPGNEACVCHLTDPIGLTQPTVTHHLQVLHEAGLLTREKRGIWVYYRIAPGPLAVLRDALATPCSETAAAESQACTSAPPPERTDRSPTAEGS